MNISFECRGSFTGTWHLRLRRDLSTERWSLAVTQQSSRQLISDHQHYDPGTGRVQFERGLSAPEEATLHYLLARTALPLVPEFAAGLDGTTWRLSISHGYNTVEAEWWSDLPRAWERLRPVADFLTALAEVQWNPDAEPTWDSDEDIPEEDLDLEA